PVSAAPAAVATPAPAAPGAALPYPCPEARVGLQKNARTGNLTLELSGCPMGTYSYCPQCPIYVSVAGLRRLVFG
ncbi:MAG TPA: hypothetical protein VNZ52_07215, partial [Candidatus Thermoplasmatota archaeon]|nr:hypothetical protein [Candidatus Thermoplasmatota archaeon]